MNVLAFIGNIIKPISELIDKVHTSDAERMQLKNELVTIQNQLAGKVLEYETKLMDSQTSVIKAEATGHSWIQRNWRPITMLTFLVLVILNSFGLLAVALNPEAWALLKIGLGGYVIGRSAEKITPALAETLKKKE